MPASFAHLRFDGVSVSFGTHRVLTNVSITVPAQGVTGIIGENGCGKSTLLRLAAGLMPVDAGTITAIGPGGTRPRIGFLPQTPQITPHETIEQTLESAIAYLRSITRTIEQAATLLAHSDSATERTEAGEAYAAALEQAERLNVWDIDARVDATLDGLGLSHLPRHRPTSHLSGGQLSRLSLACVLLSNPDILLLDEPTNHLDDAATAYLQDMVSHWQGPVLIVSHDRSFLDNVATNLVDLDPRPLPHRQDDAIEYNGITRFSGTYSDYLQVQRDERRRWAQQYRDEQAELRRLKDAVHDSHSVGHGHEIPRTESRAARKFYADRNAKVVSRRVTNARSRLATLQQQQVSKPPRELRFAGFTAATGIGNSATAGGLGELGGDDAVLAATNVSVSQRLSPVSLAIEARDRWLITGANGVGKSTLLQVLAGELPPTSGHVTRLDGVRVGLLTQETRLPSPPTVQQWERPSASQKNLVQWTACRAYEQAVGIDRATEVPLSTFGLLAARDENRVVAELSVGQQRRLALAILLANPPEVLLLDEPTNHLSLRLVTELEQAIPDYPGAIVVASHDRWLRNTWQGKRLHLAG